MKLRKKIKFSDQSEKWKTTLFIQHSHPSDLWVTDSGMFSFGSIAGSAFCLSEQQASFLLTW